MKRWISFGAALALALALCVGFGQILAVYSRPMENVSYDFSLGWSSEAIPDDWVYDQKGWTVFTQEGQTVTELIPDGFGGFDGLSEPGQTFYFSRVLTEELDSPTLRLDVADRTFSVFLDGTLIYTDCPELPNRIGSLRLPMLDWSRDEPLLVNLPLDCAGRTLTIAQSTDVSFAESGGTVWPCAVTLYCGYAYESALISESFQTAMFATLFYAAGLALLAMFLWQTFQGRPDPGTLCGALAAFSCLAAQILQLSFRHIYLGSTLIDVYQSRYLTLIALLAMLACKLSGRRRRILGVVTAALGVLAPVGLVLMILQNSQHPLMAASSITYSAIETWVSSLGGVGLLLTLIFGFWEWNRRKWFFRLFCPLTLAGIAFHVLPTVLGEDLSGVTPSFFLWPLLIVSLLAAFAAAVTELVHGEAVRRTEARLLAQRSELALNSYEAMRRQHEQVMMLRHDMTRHFQLLRQTTGDEKTAAYLDELIGQDKKIRPVVQSGNEMLDIILNSKLDAAADAGIAVKIVRMQAPEKLPLSDAELCSLMVNILDNALEAASAPGVERPYIKLDLRIKDHFFVLFCENSATLEHIQKETAPGHGLGLKIIQQIAARYDNLLETQYAVDSYRVKLAIPLD